MDPFTQGALGAAASLSWKRRKSVAMPFIAGWLGGMAADLDVFIRSKTDPLLFLEYHRHFTHSLLFIPVGGMAVGTLLWFFFFQKRGWSWREVIFSATLGYATHGLLDASTTYGTLLYWPVSMTRVAWNIVAIIDPFYTGLLVIGIVLTLLSRSPAWARGGLILSLCYLAVAALQRDKATQLGHELASQRGHAPVRLEAKPTLLNAWLWRIVYEHDNRFFVDAVHISPWAGTKIYEGESVEKIASPPADWPRPSVIADDFERFRWFSNDYLMRHPRADGVIGDVRYAMVPHSVEPLWGIKADLLYPEKHAEYVTTRVFDTEKRQSFWKMLLGRDF